MGNGNDKFILRFYDDDNNVNPESFTAKELGQLLISFHEGLKELIDLRYPELNPDDVRLSLIGIENKSESLIWKHSGQKELNSALADLGRSVTKNTYTDLPRTTYRTVRNLFTLTKEKGCNAELVQRGERLFVVSGDDKLIKQENLLVKSDMVLHGELNKIGGDRLRAWVELYDGSRISFDINNEQLIKLRGKVKEPIAIRGKATWNVVTKKVVYFKINEVIDYQYGEVSKGFEEIRKITSGGWDTINNNRDLLNFLKGDA